MPTPGNISPKARRCLENLAVAGPSSAADLNALDPTAPDHRQTIKALEQSSYVVAAYKLTHDLPTRYSLTAKARALLAGKTLEAAHTVPTPSPTSTRANRYARHQEALGSVAAPLTHGSQSTKKMHHPCADMLAPATRSGAEQALQIPSRVNDVLHYRDGRKVCIDHATTVPSP